MPFIFFFKGFTWRLCVIPDFYVVLVEPKISGNIGAVARAMANFDFHNLFLVNPCELDDDCYRRAKHAGYILDEAKIFDNIEDCIQNLDYLVATSSIDYKKDKKHLRSPVYLDDFVDKIFEVEGKVGLLFGREDYGLFNEEIKKCDIMLRIPTSKEYSSMNLSHAVALTLYPLFVKTGFEPKKRRKIGDVEKDKLFEYFSKLLDEIGHPEHKKRKTRIMFKRLMGRAMPSTWEYHRFMGIFSDILKKIRKNEDDKE
ncbi:MAG: RNA methyltransferase [Candidatus Thermoplasmatota archaeon]